MKSIPANAVSILALLAAIVLGACAERHDVDLDESAVVEEASPPTDLERAQAAAGEFSTRLRTALREHMGSEGPVSALDFCHDQAPQIADAIMAVHGLRLGRVAIADRVRNPGNTANEWQQPVLDRFAAAVAAGQAPEDQVAVLSDDLPDGIALRLMRGIRVEPQCQLCHGRELSPGIADAVARLYPDDRAIGFVEGDLRGALWVEVPQTSQAQGTPQ